MNKNSKLTKFVVVSASAFMMLSLGAGMFNVHTNVHAMSQAELVRVLSSKNPSATANRWLAKHGGATKTAKHNHKRRNKYTKHMHKSHKGKYNAYNLFANVWVGDKLGMGHDVDRGDMLIDHGLMEVPKESAKKLKSYPSNSGKYPLSSAYYSHAGNTLDSIISHGADPVYDDTNNDGTTVSRNYVKSYTNGIKKYAPMSYDRDFEKAYIGHNIRRNVNKNTENNSASYKSDKRIHYYQAREALIKLQHYASSKSNLYKNSFIDGANDCYNHSSYKRYHRYAQLGTNSKRNFYKYAHGWYDGDLFTTYGTGNYTIESPANQVSDNFTSNPNSFKN